MKRLVIVTLGAAASLALAACGGGGGGSSTTASSSTTTTTQAAGGGGGQTVSLSADPSGTLAYQQSSLTAKPGNNTIAFDNPASLGHDVCVQDSSGKKLGCSSIVTQGNTTLNVALKPGTYTYYCSVDGHEAAGMKGTLSVK
jgi:plastocyanin